MNRPKCCSVLVLLAILLQACAVLKPLPPPSTVVGTDCERLFDEMDRQIEDYGVADAGTGLG